MKLKVTKSNAKRERELKLCDMQYITEGFLLVISEMIANCLVSITSVILP